MFSITLRIVPVLFGYLFQPVAIVALAILVLVKRPANPAVTSRLMIGLGLELVAVILGMFSSIAFYAGIGGWAVLMSVQTALVVSGIAALVLAGLQVGNSPLETGDLPPPPVSKRPIDFGSPQDRPTF